MFSNRFGQLDCSPPSLAGAWKVGLFAIAEIVANMGLALPVATIKAKISGLFPTRTIGARSRSVSYGNLALIAGLTVWVVNAISSV